MFINRFKNVIFGHILFCGIITIYFFVLNFLSHLDETGVFVDPFQNRYSIIIPLVSIINTYYLVYLVLPFFIKEKYFFGLLLLIFNQICIYILASFLQQLNNNNALILNIDDLIKPKNGWFMSFIFYTNFIGLVVVGFKLFRIWNKNQTQNELLFIEKNENEIQLIKNQINPNFLFSSLDNLFELTTQKSKKSAELVLKFSHLLSYFLYESQADLVPLRNEIEMIKDYCFLLENNSKSNIEISLNFMGDIENKQIEPLILLPFVENASLISQNLLIEKKWISIDLSMSKNILKFKIINSRNRFDSEPFSAYDNIKKRLDFLYRDNYQIKIVPDQETLFVGLTFNLNSKHNKLNETKMLTRRR